MTVSSLSFSLYSLISLLLPLFESSRQIHLIFRPTTLSYPNTSPEADPIRKPRIITPSLLSDDPTRSVPAVLSLPPGKFFFGYKYVPFDPTKAPKPKPTPAELEDAAASSSKPSFGGEGVTLKGKRKAADPAPPATAGEVKEEKEADDPWAKFGSGSGNTLKKPSIGKKEVKREPSPPTPQEDVIDATMSEDEEEWAGIVESDDEEAYIEIDSD